MIQRQAFLRRHGPAPGAMHDGPDLTHGGWRTLRQGSTVRPRLIERTVEGAAPAAPSWTITGHGCGHRVAGKTRLRSGLASIQGCTLPSPMRMDGAADPRGRRYAGPRRYPASVWSIPGRGYDTGVIRSSRSAIPAGKHPGRWIASGRRPGRAALHSDPGSALSPSSGPRSHETTP